MILMHKDTAVAEIEMREGRIINTNRIFSRVHLPVGTDSEYPQLMTRKLQNWQTMRCIPGERQNRERIEQALRCTVSEALLKSLAVSLTDCYWFREENKELHWKDVNFHDNGFSTDVASAVLFRSNGPVLRFNSPDLTTDGVLEKAWIGMSGVPTLVKYGNLGVHAGACGRDLLSANEVAASRVATLMEINHVPYYPVRVEKENRIVCACPCFVHDSNVEFVNHLQFLQANRSITSEQSFDALCKRGYEKEVSRMLVFDHILHNVDRHEKNFGTLRDPDTLKEECFAPLFDSGACLGWNKNPGAVDMGETKPFLSDRMKQLSLVKPEYLGVPDEREVRTIIHQTYEEFELPEVCFEIAADDLSHSYRMLYERENERIPVSLPDEEIER